MSTEHKTGTSGWRAQHWKACQNANIVVATLLPGVKVHVARDVVPAVWELGARLRLHAYEVRQGTTGAYNCRNITGGRVLSAHAYGIAVDVNWDSNPYSTKKLVTDMPRAMIEDIETIRTVEGVPVWRWGGDWDGRPETPHANYDAMHFEVVATPAQLAAGFSINMDPANRRSWRTIQHVAGYPVMQGPAVRLVERYLGIPQSGRYTEYLKRAVVSYQLSRKLSTDGVVGDGTWTALINSMPPVHSTESPPSKTWPHPIP